LAVVRPAQTAALEVVAGGPAQSPTTPADSVTVTYGAEPWGRREFVGFAALTALGGAFLGAGYLGTSAELQLGEQVPFLDLGVAGVVVAGVGGVAWLTTGLRAVRSRKAAVLAQVRSRFDGASAVDDAAPGAEVLVAGARMTRYHRPDCLLVAGKPVSPGSPADQRRAGRRPCGVCVR
jgi:hypothetical protein